MSAAVERKLTTILCADVAGYSRMMEKDEVATLQSLKIAREVFNSEIAEHSGRLINMVGDGLIADFDSVVNAVHCAVAIQSKLSDKHSEGVFSVPLHFRIGLNLGDVMIEGEDIFGDGVNIAARLESLAPTGGICISGTVYDHVKGKFPSGFEYLGEKHVKNIKGGVDVYSLKMEHRAPETEPVQEEQEPYEPIDGLTQDEEMALRKQIRKQAGFYRRAASMGTLILFLFIINMLTSPGALWFYWPALPICFILAMDGFRVFGKGHFDDDWEERKLAEMRKGRNSKSRP